MPKSKIVTLETHFQRIEVKPGDLFVLLCKHTLSEQEFDQIQSVWQKFIGDHKLVILDQGMKLGVFSKEENPK